MSFTTMSLHPLPFVTSISSLSLYVLLTPFLLVAGSPSYCSLPSDAGTCKGYFEKFYFDQESKVCLKFRYGGCMGNANNFNSMKDCEDICKENKTSNKFNIRIKKEDYGEKIVENELMGDILAIDEAEMITDKLDFTEGFKDWTVQHFRRINTSSPSQSDGVYEIPGSPGDGDMVAAPEFSSITPNMVGTMVKKLEVETYSLVEVDFYIFVDGFKAKDTNKFLHNNPSLLVNIISEEKNKTAFQLDKPSVIAAIKNGKWKKFRIKFEWNKMETIQLVFEARMGTGVDSKVAIDDVTIKRIPRAGHHLAAKKKITSTTDSTVTQSNIEVQFNVAESSNLTLKATKSSIVDLTLKSTKSSTVDANVTEATLVDLNVTGSTVLHLNDTEHNVVDLHVTESSVVDLNVTKSGVVDFNVTEYSVMDKNVSEPSVVDINVTESSGADLNITESRTVNVNITESSGIVLNATESSIAYFNVTGSTFVVDLNITESSMINPNVTENIVSTDSNVIRLQNASGYNVTGPTVTGSSVTGYSVTGFNITGSSVIGSNVTGSQLITPIATSSSLASAVKTSSPAVTLFINSSVTGSHNTTGQQDNNNTYFPVKTSSTTVGNDNGVTSQTISNVTNIVEPESGKVVAEASSFGRTAEIVLICLVVVFGISTIILVLKYFHLKKHVGDFEIGTSRQTFDNPAYDTSNARYGTNHSNS